MMDRNGISGRGRLDRWSVRSRNVAREKRREGAIAVVLAAWHLVLMPGRSRQIRRGAGLDRERTARRRGHPAGRNQCAQEERSRESEQDRKTGLPRH